MIPQKFTWKLEDLRFLSRDTGDYNPHHVLSGPEGGQFTSGPETGGGSGGSAGKFGPSSLSSAKITQQIKWHEKKAEEIDEGSYEQEGDDFDGALKQHAAHVSIIAVLKNDEKAHKNPGMAATSVFEYVEKNGNVVAALHYSIEGGKAELKWAGSISPGAGRKLMEKAIAHAKSSGVKEIELAAKFGSEKFHERLGFKITGKEDPLGGTFPMTLKLGGDPWTPAGGKIGELERHTAMRDYTKSEMDWEYDREYKVYSAPHFPTAFSSREDFQAKYDAAPLVHLSTEELRGLGNSMAASGLNKGEQWVHQTFGHRRDVGRILTALKSGKTAPPIILAVGEKLWLMAGQTRLAAGLALGKSVPVKKISVQKARDAEDFNPHHVSSGSEGGQFTTGGGGGGGGGSTSGGKVSAFKQRMLKRREVLLFQAKKKAFTTSGSKGGGVGPAAALLASEHNPKDTMHDVVGKLSKEELAEIVKVETELGKMVPTASSVDKGGFMQKDGTYTPERQAVHAKIIREAFSKEKIEAARPEPGQDPTLVVLGGRPASGKTTVVLKTLDPKLKGSIYLNPDDIKAQLPGFQLRHAAIYHHESADISMQIERIARKIGLNVIYDATMKTGSTTTKRVDDFIKAGYQVEGYYVHVTPTIAAVRTVKRFLNTGRYVPPEISFNSRTNEANFDSLTEKFSKWAVYNNNGKSAVKVAEGKKK